jgi:acetylornithine deacetylase/succinyl-diaminopimelate desuccinylase-like protein
VRDALGRAGLAAEVHETAGHPIVLGEWRGAPGAPTLLVYGHYDVQPAEPLELWDSPAFEPAVRDGRIYARGSVDDKGQLFLHVKALEAHLRTTGRLPVNVVVLAEGEEEVGSEHLAEFVEANAARLRCDAVVISDSAMFAPGVPSILSSLRGLAYFQIDVQGPAGDLHSGATGARWSTRRPHWRASSPRSTTPTGGWPSPGSTTPCARGPSTCARRCAGCRSTRSTSAPRPARPR